MVAGGVPLCFHKQNADKAPERLKGASQTSELLEAAAWLRPLYQACLGKAPAGVQIKCRELADRKKRGVHQPGEGLWTL